MFNFLDSLEAWADDCVATNQIARIDDVLEHLSFFVDGPAHARSEVSCALFNYLNLRASACSVRLMGCIDAAMRIEAQAEDAMATLATFETGSL